MAISYRIIPCMYRQASKLDHVNLYPGFTMAQWLNPELSTNNSLQISFFPRLIRTTRLPLRAFTSIFLFTGTAFAYFVVSH